MQQTITRKQAREILSIDAQIKAVYQSEIRRRGKRSKRK